MDTDSYCEQGTGPGIIFAHGTLMDWTMFQSQIEACSPTNHVVAYNHRARTERYPESYDLGDLAQDCIAVADEFGMETFVLAGMSMGGYMAIEVALRHQDRLDGLILIDAMAGAYSDQKRADSHAFLPKLDIDGDVPGWYAQSCVERLFGPKTIAEQGGLIDHWLQRWARIPARSAHREFLSWIDKHDRTARLGEITVPTLICHGIDDAVLPLETSALPLRDGISGSRLAVIEGAGHTSNCEQPQAVNAAILEFLAGIRRH